MRDRVMLNSASSCASCLPDTSRLNFDFFIWSFVMPMRVSSSLGEKKVRDEAGVEEKESSPLEPVDSSDE
jgi:hypothetical protein